MQRVSIPIQGAVKLPLQAHKGDQSMANRKGVKKMCRLAKQKGFSKSNRVKVDPLEGKQISEDLDLCIKNARLVGQYMKEGVTIYSFGKGKAITYFFRLENDPRETCEYFKKEVDFGF
tara:strand:+ start:418 stop:771 length:354 start_codon:yes stop_codon:yes gene_type:complete